MGIAFYNCQRIVLMDKDRFKSVVSVLKRYELTKGQKRFVQLTEQYFYEKGILNDEQESALEGIYREQKKWGKSQASPNKDPSRTQALEDRGEKKDGAKE